jgi:hypothetical protein
VQALGKVRNRRNAPDDVEVFARHGRGFAFRRTHQQRTAPYLASKRTQLGCGVSNWAQASTLDLDCCAC